MHELPLRFVFAFDGCFSVDGMRSLRWRHIRTRRSICVRALPSGDVLLPLLLWLECVRELRCRHVLSIVRIGPVHDVPSWGLFEHNGGIGVDGMFLLRCRTILALCSDGVQRLLLGQLPKRKCWNELHSVLGRLLLGQRS